MTGSGLQLETPFGLSVLKAGRFYGIGNEALGIYGLSGLFGAAWLALVLLRRYAPSRRPAVLAVAVVAGVRGVRVGLARVRRQGGRHHRHGATWRSSPANSVRGAGNNGPVSTAKASSFLNSPGVRGGTGAVVSAAGTDCRCSRAAG